MRQLMLVTVSALALAVAVPAVAQNAISSNPVVPSTGYISRYIVQQDDNLWTLAQLRLGNPERWRWVVEQNPMLQEPGRVFERNGMTYVMIRPGEALYGLEEAGITINDSRAAANPAPVTSSQSTRDTSEDWSWLWWLLLIPLVGGFIWFLLRRELRKDPVDSGPRQVPGGVHSAEVARERFVERGYRQHFTVLSMTPGHITGTMMVRYGNGTERPRTLNRERAFQAHVRHEDGQTEDLYMLQACGNDLRYGGIARYLPGPNFRFEPDAEETPAPAPQPEAAAEEPPVVAPAPAPAPEEAPPAPSSTEPELKVELKPAEHEGDTSMIRVTGAPTEDLVLSITGNSFTLRFHPPKKG